MKLSRVAVKHTMEDTSAAFVSMVMDRLQAAEKCCDLQQQDIDALRSENATMRERLLMTPHMCPDSYTEYSEGEAMQWVVGHPPMMLVANPNAGPTNSGSKPVVAKEEHLNATMFCGRKSVKLPAANGAQFFTTIGGAYTRTTMGSFTSKVNAMAKDCNATCLRRLVSCINEDKGLLTLNTVDASILDLHPSMRTSRA